MLVRIVFLFLISLGSLGAYAEVKSCKAAQSEVCAKYDPDTKKYDACLEKAKIFCQDESEVEKQENDDKVACDGALEKFVEAENDFRDVCKEAGGDGKCFNTASKCQACSATGGTASNDDDSYSKADCKKDVSKGKRRYSSSYMDNILKAYSGKPLNSSKPTNDQLENKKKRYKSCPLMALEGRKELKEESNTLRKEIREFDEDLDKLKQAVFDAKAEETKALRDHENKGEEIDARFKSALKKLNAELKITFENEILLIESMGEGLTKIQTQIDNMVLQREEAASALEDKKDEQKLKCLAHAQSVIDKKVIDRLENQKNNNHGSGDIKSYYKGSLRSDFRKDRNFLRNERLKCMKSKSGKDTSYERAIVILERAHKRARKRINLTIRELQKEYNRRKLKLESAQRALPTKGDEQKRTIRELEADWKKELNKSLRGYFGVRGRMGIKAQKEQATAFAEEKLRKAMEYIQDRQGEYEQLMALVSLAESTPGTSTEKGSVSNLLTEATILNRTAQRAKSSCGCETPDDDNSFFEVVDYGKPGQGKGKGQGKGQNKKDKADTDDDDDDLPGAYKDQSACKSIDSLYNQGKFSKKLKNGRSSLDENDDG